MTLENRLQAFDDTRRGLVDEMEALDPALLVAKPIPGKWSMIEIVEHLVLAERAVFSGMPDPRRLVEKNRDFGNRVRYVLVLDPDLRHSGSHAVTRDGSAGRSRPGRVAPLLG